MNNIPFRMKLLAAASTLMAAFAAAPLVSQELTLEQAVAQALQSNPDLAVDVPGRSAAEADLAASRAGYLPRLDFEQSYMGGNNPVYVFGTLLTQRRFTAANFALPSLNKPDAVDNLQTRLSTQLTLWDAGRTRRRVEGARIGLEVTERGHEDHRRQVLLEVLDAYFSVSYASEAWEATRASLESAEALVKQADDRVQAGLAIESDVLRGRVFLTATRQQEIAARGQLDIARTRLNRLMGEPLDAALGRTALLKPVRFPVPDEEALRAELRRRRPDYQRMLAELNQAELEVASRRAEYLPSLGAFASWEADNPSLSDAGGSNWTAGVSLRWNIFAGGADSARLQAARHRLEQKRRQIAAMDSAMALEIHSALIQYRTAAQQVEVTQAAEAQSLEGLRILKNRYDAGLATMTDLLSAESQRAAARSLLSEALYRQRISFARIEYAAGILNPTSTAMIP